MQTNALRTGCTYHLTRCVAMICVILLAPGNPTLFATQAQQSTEGNAKIPADQLDALVAPIALYPDPLLTQTLVASTYPLEIMFGFSPF